MATTFKNSIMVRVITHYPEWMQTLVYTLAGVYFIVTLYLCAAVRTALRAAAAR